MNTVAQSPLNILVVQDSTLSAIELECVLEDLGHRVADVAVTPDIAMARLKRAHVDAVIFDAMQMGLPAYGFARAVAKRGVTALVTSHYPETFVRVLGFDQPYLAKPYRHQDVAALVNSVQPRVTETAAA